MKTIDDADLRHVIGGVHYRPGATPPAPFARVAIWGRTNYVAELKGWIHRSGSGLPGRP